MVLGTIFILSGRVSKELNRRITCAWGQFHQIRPLLCRRHTDLNLRLRLFGSTVSKTVLWCCDSWSLTSEEKRMLLTTQRAMLRRFAAKRRSPDEDYISWVQHATLQAEMRAWNAGVSSWLDRFSQLKWHWAGHVVRMAESRLARRTSLWRDSEWWNAEKFLPNRPLHAQA